jgi:hypothetical protein
MRPLAVTAIAILSCAAFGQSRIAVLPLDSRPPTAQMPVLLARIAGVEAVTPDLSLLGEFTKPGDTDRVREWIRTAATDAEALVLSADMIAYGGLIASREPKTPAHLAIERLQVLRQVRKNKPDLPIYVYSALMRVAPTATDSNEPWRMDLARLVELEEKYQRTGSKPSEEYLDLKRRVPKERLEEYWKARKRNIEVQKELIRMVKEGVITYLVIGSDDTRRYGPQYPERMDLQRTADSLGILGRVYLCEGIDQAANLLVSRAILLREGYRPVVRIVLADEAAGSRPAAYESQPLLTAIQSQILASGAFVVDKNEQADYVLFVNTERSTTYDISALLNGILSVQDGRPYAAVADINFDSLGSPDERFSRAILDSGLLPDLLSYASWNTASNTIGTAVAQANLYLTALRKNTPVLEREVAQQTFLLHRLISDYGYHSFLRPRANRALDQAPDSTPLEARGYVLRVMQEWVDRNAGGLLQKYFEDFFQGREIRDGDRVYVLADVANVRVRLPWPRAFEAWFEFELVVKPKVGTAEPPSYSVSRF